MDNAESRELVESCYRHRKILLNPIIEWSDDEVWEFIHKYKVPYCDLYDKGFKRIGCIGCPMSTRQAQELERYPKYKTAYLKAFARMIKVRAKDGMTNSWETPEAVMEWWVSGKTDKPLDGQLSLDQYMQLKE